MKGGTASGLQRGGTGNGLCLLGQRGENQPLGTAPQSAGFQSCISLNIRHSGTPWRYPVLAMWVHELPLLLVGQREGGVEVRPLVKPQRQNPDQALLLGQATSAWEPA